MAYIHSFNGPNFFVADASVSYNAIFLVLQGCDITGVVMFVHSKHVIGKRPKLFNFQ